MQLKYYAGDLQGLLGGLRDRVTDEAAGVRHRLALRRATRSKTHALAEL